ncbi:MAG: cysteine desulfurase family protein [Cyclobacterium sp.]|uniref:cysteine desulfurase family protein n=1 Tax=Cyclobacterium sp. TaxID=1966343 RepID=UPI003970CB12
MFEDLIYLDNNATTPLDPIVLEAMMPYMTYNFANAASTHHFGMTANEAVKKARQQVADLIGAEPYEIVFTSGATEAINLAIKGVSETYLNKGNHIVTASTEHSAVLDTCKYLETKGFEVSYLPVQSNGLLDMELVKKAIRKDTILVSVMHVNNETGVIQSIKEIAELAHEKGAIFMSDTTQSVGKTPINVEDIGIDLLSISAHKMYGPKGIGALYFGQKENRIKIPTQIHGGGHEGGLRSGTLNVPGIVGLGKACELAGKEMKENKIKIKKMRDDLEEKLLSSNRVKLNCKGDTRIFNTINFRVDGLDANILIGIVKNIAFSNGSACTSAIIEPSHVLTEMGLTEQEAFSSIRISLGKFNTLKEIKYATEKLSPWIN